MAKDILCAFGVDVDAVAGWLGSYGGEDSPDDISRGLFAGEIGAPRLLKLFERYGLRTTWFIPGHSMETFPEQMKAVADAGHEIGVHGYSHENPIAMTAEAGERQREEDQRRRRRRNLGRWSPIERSRANRYARTLGRRGAISTAALESDGYDLRCI